MNIEDYYAKQADEIKEEADRLKNNPQELKKFFETHVLKRETEEEKRNRGRKLMRKVPYSPSNMTKEQLDALRPAPPKGWTSSESRRASHLDMTYRNPTSSIRRSQDQIKLADTNTFDAPKHDGWYRVPVEYPVTTIDYAGMSREALLRVIEEATAEIRRRYNDI